jgi:hypothetical protein
MDRVHFGLLLPDWRLLGDTEFLRRAFKSGKIAAAVIDKPGAPPDEVPDTGDLKAEFERRFILVTAENIDEVLKSYPRLF